MMLKLLFIAVFLTSCSIKEIPNEWKYKSADAFNSYTKNFLSNNQLLAKSNLKNAVKYAKQGGDIEQLTHIYLSVCGLNKSVDINSGCKVYKNIQQLVNHKKTDAYYNMLQNKLEESQIIYLPKRYQAFVKFKNTNQYNEAFDEIISMDKTTSKFIAASLIKEHLNKEEVNYLIQIASFHGYKKLILFWLNHLKNIETDADEKKRIVRKIELLGSL